jgi:hypothetical protein
MYKPKFYILLKISLLHVNGLAIFPFIFTKKNTQNKVLINHELIHHRQQLELLIFPFYLWYVFEYLLKLARYQSHSKAYRHISFEQEAYQHDSDLNYLKNRPIWAFLKYI